MAPFTVAAVAGAPETSISRVCGKTAAQAFTSTSTTSFEAPEVIATCVWPTLSAEIDNPPSVRLADRIEGSATLTSANAEPGCQP